MGSFYRLPLSALRAFEAAARQQSYSRAADELGLSHGAISHHIKGLEANLGVCLFKRDGAKMVPTEHGQRLAVHASEGFTRLAQGVDEVRARVMRSRVVTVSVLPAFAARWLIPRMVTFQEAHPDVEVSIRASHLLTDFSRDGVDVALRYGPGQWPGLSAELLAEEVIFPVCSPAFQGKYKLTEPTDLLSVRLLRDQRVPWSTWFRAAALDHGCEPNSGSAYSDAGLLLQAAVAGHGVALARSVLARGDLDAGSLVRLFETQVPAQSSYYLVYPSGVEMRRPAQVFREWLLREAAEDQDVTARLTEHLANA